MHNYIIMVLFILNQSILAFETFGGHESGGGTGLAKKKGAPPILLELLDYDLNFQDTFKTNSNLPIKDKSFSPGLRFPLADTQNTETYQFALTLLDKWKRNSPQLIKLITDSLANLKVIPVDAYLTVNKFEPLGIDPEVLLKNFPKARVHRLATYTYREGVYLSYPLFKKLGDYSRAGLFIKETLRRWQILEKVGMTPTQISQLTAVIVLGNPDEVGSLETDQFIPISKLGHILTYQKTSAFLEDIKAYLDQFKRKVNRLDHAERFIDNINDLDAAIIKALQVEKSEKTFSSQEQITRLLCIKQIIFDIEIVLLWIKEGVLSNQVKVLGKKLSRLIDKNLGIAYSNWALDSQDFMRAGNPLNNTVLLTTTKVKRKLKKFKSQLIKRSRANKKGVSLSKMKLYKY